MGNLIIKNRIQEFRDLMKLYDVDAYMIPTADFHNSEYVNKYFCVREFLSGFTGSNGTLVITKNEVGLWTDGRYFIQAEKELKDTGIQLYKMQEEDVPTILEYLVNVMKKNDTLGFDGRVIDTKFGVEIEEALENSITINYELDLGDLVWKSRPPMPQGNVFILQEKYTGLNAKAKLLLVKEQMNINKVQGFFLSKLDDIMWLFNIRGQDVTCNPVALSYAYISREKVYLFLQKKVISHELLEYAEKMEFEILYYEELLTFFQNKILCDNVLVDNKNTSYFVYKKLCKSATCIDLDNPTSILKAIKNNTEMKCMKNVYIKDSVAVTKFIYWLKKNVGKISINEVSAANYLDKLRKDTEGFVDFSFPTISAYEENAAMMHYEAKPQSCKEIIKKGMLLVDSGGQYYGGTTDVTRTIIVGTVSDEKKKHFTGVVMGMLQLADAHFLYGCTGRNLDILARIPLWNMDIDYKCGTGHGIGCMLNVHEGPQSIRWRYQKDVTEITFEENMVVSNEPGVYIEGSYGIRTENIMVCKKGNKNHDGQFMHFETLTFVPIDIDGILNDMMNEHQKELLNTYHERVYQTIFPFLNKDEVIWLRKVTSPI